jgi:uncharacterized phage protein gp47/JayE
MALFPFEPKSLLEITRRVIDDIRTRLGTAASLLSHTAEAALAGVVAGVAHPLWRALDRASRASLWAVTLDTTYLPLWASTFGVYQRDPIKATGIVTFTGTAGLTVPAGTRVQRSPDGFEYITDEEGELIGLGTASIPVTAKTAGTLGNATVGTTLFLIGAIPGINSTAMVDGADITNGADKEDLLSLLGRFLDRIRNPPRGGGKGDYIRWAKEARNEDGLSLGITRAWEYGGEPNLGYVTVRAVRDSANADVATLTGDERTTLREYILERMPLGMDCVVPDDVVVVNLDPIIKLRPNTTTTQAAAKRALYLALSRGTIGDDDGEVFLLSLLNQALLDEPTIIDHQFVSPVGNIALTDKQVLTLGTPVWQTLPEP